MIYTLVNEMFDTVQGEAVYAWQIHETTVVPTQASDLYNATATDETIPDDDPDLAIAWAKNMVPGSSCHDWKPTMIAPYAQTVYVNRNEDDDTCTCACTCR